MRGRKISLTKEQRTENLIGAVRRSGFCESEVYAILYKWYGRNSSLFAEAPALYTALDDLVADARLVRKCAEYDNCDVCKAEVVLRKSGKAVV